MPARSPEAPAAFERLRYYDPGLLKQLTNELERRFDVDELLQVCAVQLNHAPEVEGLADSRATLARWMVEMCVEEDSVWALIDAVRQRRGELHPLLQLHISNGVAGAPALQKGDELGGYLLLKELERDDLAAHFWARKDGDDYRLQVLGYHASVDSARLQRLRVVLRRAAEVPHPCLEVRPSLERLDGLHAVVSGYQRGQTLQERLERNGGMAFGAARKLIRKLLEPLCALHSAGVVHGQLSSRNVVLFTDSSGPSLCLMGAGGNWLWDGTLAHVPSVALAPELLKGGEPTPASDVYAFGALIFELVAGFPVFTANNPQELATLHLSQAPPALSTLRGARNVPASVERLVERALSKDPSERPKDAMEFLSELQVMGSVSMPPPALLGPAEVATRLEALKEAPGDRKRLTEVLEVINHGGDARTVAEELWNLAHDLQEPELDDVRSRLLEEAAQVYHGPCSDPAGAKSAYLAALDTHPGDSAILSALVQILEELQEHTELVRIVDLHGPHVEGPVVRAKLLARAAAACEAAGELEGALSRYVDAFCLQSSSAFLVGAVERLAPQVVDGWARVIQACLRFATPSPHARLTPERLAVLNRLARWYERTGQVEAAEESYKVVLNGTQRGEAEQLADPVAVESPLDPDGPTELTRVLERNSAFEGLVGVMRRQERWGELAQLLTDFASAPQTPPVEARDLLAEAAQVYSTRLGSVEAAAALYQRVFDLDPGHEAAAEGLLGYYESLGDWGRYAETLARLASAFRGERRAHMLCRAADILAQSIGDDEAAAELYRQALDQIPAQTDALDGLTSILTQSGRYQELLDALIEQLDAVGTPRQKAVLWERIATLYESEYLDRRAAINAFEQAVALAPSSESAWMSLVRLQTAEEEWGEVARAYRELLSLREAGPSHLDTGLALADVLEFQLNDVRAAADLLEEFRRSHAGDGALLQRLAQARMHAGELDEGLLLFDEVAETLVDLDERATHYYTVGRLLERAGYSEEAIERYKFAVEANPRVRAFSATLKEIYERVGDHAANYELLRGELRFASGASAQAKIYGELARLALERLGDDARAEEMAIRAQSLDPTSFDANYVRGLLAYKQGRYGDAAGHLQHLAGVLSRFGERACELGVKYAYALLRSGRQEQAAKAADELLLTLPDDAEALSCAAEIAFEGDDPQRSVELHRRLVTVRRDISTEARAVMYFRLGTSAAQAGYYTEAIAALQDSLALNSSQPDALEVLSHCYEQEQLWQEMADTLYAELEFAESDRRYELLMSLGDLAHTHLGEPEYAAQNYLLVHRDWPQDRRVLLKLLQVYSELDRWKSVATVILKLVDLIDDDPAAQARYLRVAALVAARKLGDITRGNKLLDRALSLDPEAEELVDAALKLSRASGDGKRLASMLKREIRIASKHQDKGRMMAALGELADVYLNKLGSIHQAIAVHEGALELDPDNHALQEYLKQAYAAHPTEYLDKAIALNQKALDVEPLRPDAIRALRQLYTRARNADAAWCVCRVLSVLELATDEENDFFERLRSEQVAIVTDGFQPGEWTKLLLHPGCESALTGILVVLQPAVLAACALGHGQRWRADMDRLNPIGHPSAVLGSLAYISDVLALPVPEVVVDLRSEQALALVPGNPPVFVVGQAGLNRRGNVQEAAVIATRSVVRVLPGLGLHPLLGSTGELKVWLFAGLRLIHPKFATPDVLEEDVQTAQEWLAEQLNAEQLEHLSWLTNQLLRRNSSVDLKKWGAAADFTADRLALLFADDLDVVVQAIRERPEPYAIASEEARLAEICRFAVSEAYLEVRRRLGIAVS